MLQRSIAGRAGHITRTWANPFMQVVGELNSAMQSIADFNRIVWDEVNQTCKAESDRISRSFHLRNLSQKAFEGLQVCV